MGIYFNPGRSPLPVTLCSGAALSVPAKGRVDIAPHEEGSESVQRAVDKGHLTRLSVPQAAAPVDPTPELPIRFPGDPVEVPKPELAPAPVAEPVEALDEDSDHVVRGDEGPGLTPPGSRKSRRPT